METHEFSRFINVTQIRTHDLTQTYEAKPDELAALCLRFQLEELSSLTCQIHAGASANGKDVVVRGSLEAKVIQSCIRTGMPVKNTIKDEFVVILRKTSKRQEEEPFDAEQEEMMDIEYHETPKVNIGEIIAQYLSLNLDPYPKASCTSQPIHVEANKHEKFKELEPPSPFAIIKNMIDKTKS